MILIFDIILHFCRSIREYSLTPVRIANRSPRTGAVRIFRLSDSNTLLASRLTWLDFSARAHRKDLSSEKDKRAAVQNSINLKFNFPASL